MFYRIEQLIRFLVYLSQFFFFFILLASRNVFKWLHRAIELSCSSRLIVIVTVCSLVIQRIYNEDFRKCQRYIFFGILLETYIAENYNDLILVIFFISFTRMCSFIYFILFYNSTGSKSFYKIL